MNQAEKTSWKEILTDKHGAEMLFADENLMTKVICFIVVMIPLIELVSQIIKQGSSYQDVTLYMFGPLALLLLFFLLVNKKKVYVRTSDVFWLFLMFFAYLSLATSLDIKWSMHGLLFNCEDPIHYLGYHMLFLVCTTIGQYQNKIKIIKAYVVMFSIEIVVGFLQRFDMWPFTTSFAGSPRTGASLGLTQNNCFYGGLMVLGVALFTILFVSEQNIKKTILWFILAIATFFTAMFAMARLAWLGIGCMLLFVFCLEIFQKIQKKRSVVDMRKLCAIVGVYAIIFCIMVLWDPYVGETYERASAEVEVSQVEDFGTGRGYIWKTGLEAWTKRPILGIGLDNYREAFWSRIEQGENIKIEYQSHNDYINYLVCQGIFGFVNYVALCFWVWFVGVKRFLNDGSAREQRVLDYLLLAMIIGYYAKACLDCSVVYVAPYKWIIMGLLVPRCEQKPLFIITRKPFQIRRVKREKENA